MGFPDREMGPNWRRMGKESGTKRRVGMEVRGRTELVFGGEPDRQG